jgi:thiosulfate reductase cytochrome b subunit
MYLYPKWIRIWHVINALMFIILIVTGLSMQYTDKKSYYLVVGFSKAVKWHNFAALVLTINYIIFVTGNLFTGNGKYYRIGKILWFRYVQGRKTSIPCYHGTQI